MLAAAKPVPVPPRVCTCHKGYGDVGCNVPVTDLAQGQITSRVVPTGGWAFFQLNVRMLALSSHSANPVGDAGSCLLLHNAISCLFLHYKRCLHLVVIAKSCGVVLRAAAKGR